MPTKPIHTACAEGNLLVVQQLFAQGHVAVDEQGDHNRTPLHYACANGHLDVVQYLVEHGASVHAVSVVGETPLFDASVKGFSKIVQFLLEHGANPNAKNKYGETPKSEARNQTIKEVILNHEKKKLAEEQKSSALSPTPTSTPRRPSNASATAALSPRQASVAPQDSTSSLPVAQQTTRSRSNSSVASPRPVSPQPPVETKEEDESETVEQMDSYNPYQMQKELVEKYQLLEAENQVLKKSNEDLQQKVGEQRNTELTLRGEILQVELQKKKRDQVIMALGVALLSVVVFLYL